MRVAFANHLLGIVQVAGGNRVLKRPDEYFLHLAPTTVGGQIVMFRVIDVDLGVF